LTPIQQLLTERLGEQSQTIQQRRTARYQSLRLRLFEAARLKGLRLAVARELVAPAEILIGPAVVSTTSSKSKSTLWSSAPVEVDSSAARSTGFALELDADSESAAAATGASSTGVFR
jgi:hypothetical protein